VLDPRELHAKTVFADLEQRDSVRLLFALLLEARNDVVVCREAHQLGGVSLAGTRRSAGCGIVCTTVPSAAPLSSCCARR
jgi:hypothetical protein